MNRIKRVFVCETHEDYGEQGWRPVDMPEADPIEAVAHDTIEHFAGDDGSIAAEFMALGAMYAVRGETGWFAARPYGADPVANLAADFPELARHFVYEDFPLPDAPRTLPLREEHTDDALRAAVMQGLEMLPGEFGDTFDNEADAALIEFMAKGADILAYMRIGYRKARKRFAGGGMESIAWAFTEIDREAKELIADAYEGQLLTVSLDPSSGCVDVYTPESRRDW